MLAKLILYFRLYIMVSIVSVYHQVLFYTLSSIRYSFNPTGYEILNIFNDVHFGKGEDLKILVKQLVLQCVSQVLPTL